jgi:adenylate cyclase
MAPEPQLELAHVLFMDVIAYSTLLLEEQREVLGELKETVRATEEFRSAAARNQVVCLPTGDGMVLAFFSTPEAPVRCAIEIARVVSPKREWQLRMGIHSGPVSRVADLNEAANIAGAGVNVAQRVMDCGDAGHILLSRRVAEDLAESREWKPFLHDLGECEVKHGLKVHLFNFFGDAFGNPAVPAKLAAATQAPGEKSRSRRFPRLVSVAIAALALISLGWWWSERTYRNGATTSSELPVSDKSIAVLPFENLSKDPDNAYFADGIEEEVLTRLTRIRDLKVISRSSTAQVKSYADNLPELAHKLGVAHILQGSVQRVGDQARITVQLVEATTAAHLWAETYDRKLTDVFAIESEIARSIAAKLQAQLSGVEEHAISVRPTESNEAHQLYLRGRYFWHKRTEDALAKSVDYFNQAIARDPNYARAYSGLADSYIYMLRLGYLPATTPKQVYEAAKTAATKAVELDPELAEACSSLALIKMECDWDWAGSEQLFQRALQLNPQLAEAHHQYSHYLMSVGRNTESLRESLRALELNPLSLPINTHLAWHYLFAREYDEAIRQCKKVFDMDSRFPQAHDFIGLAYEQKGMYEEAIAEFRTALSYSGNSSHITAELGNTYAVSGNRGEALKIISYLNDRAKQTYVSKYDLAVIHVGLGDKETAFQTLEAACEERSEGLVSLKIDQRLDPARSDSRFTAIVRKLGLAK